MKNMISRSNVLGFVLFVSVAATVATVAHADCYRYVSGTAEDPAIDEPCVESLGIPRIFVRLAEDGYDLLIPNPTQDYEAMPSRQAAAAIQWLGSGTNLSNTQAAVETILEGPFPLGVPMHEQVNYNLATWLNTTGATASITTAAGGSSPRWPDSGSFDGCIVIPQCTTCELFYFIFGKWRCGAFGNDCCVIKKRIEPLPE